MGISAVNGLPQHRFNPLDILSRDNIRFHADCRFIAESIIPLSGSSNGLHFELSARAWVEALLQARVEQNGFTSFPDLFRTVNAIVSDASAWEAQLSFMECCSNSLLPNGWPMCVEAGLEPQIWLYPSRP